MVKQGPHGSLGWDGQGVKRGGCAREGGAVRVKGTKRGVGELAHVLAVPDGDLSAQLWMPAANVAGHAEHSGKATKEVVGALHINLKVGVHARAAKRGHEAAAKALGAHVQNTRRPFATLRSRHDLKHGLQQERSWSFEHTKARRRG